MVVEYGFREDFTEEVKFITSDSQIEGGGVRKSGFALQGAFGNVQRHFFLPLTIEGRGDTTGI